MPSSSEIKLDDDILWQIFMLNSHPITCSFENDAFYLLGIESHRGSPPEQSLITTRRASQVCRQWREILLNSPYIWATTLDLQHLNQEGDQWRDEVLRRTSNAPLTLLGHVGKDSVADSIPHNISTIPFFFELLNSHWERIRSLVIISASTEVNRKLQIALTRSTPLLEHCVVSFHFNDHDKSISFPTSAPALSSFIVQRQDIFLSALPWTSKIRCLQLHWSRVDVATSQLLLNLAKMPLLETLYLDFGSMYNRETEVNITTKNSHISLPRLRHFTLMFPLMHDLLPYIDLSPECRITIYCWNGLQAHKALIYSNFVQAQFHSWNITDIWYELELLQERGPEGQYCPCYDIILDDFQQDRHDIAPQFEYHGASTEMRAALSMAAALSSCQLHCVTSFHLHLDVFEDSLNDPSFDAMYNLLRKLEFVETLYSDERTLELLQVAELRSGDLMFPKLHTVIVNEWDASLERFVDSRRAGRPITRVVFSEGSNVRVGDPTVINKASSIDITVEWKIEGSKVIREFPYSSATGSQ